MKVSDLIRMLKDCPPNMEITIARYPDPKSIASGKLASGEWYIDFQDLSYTPVTTRVSEYREEVLRRCTRPQNYDAPREALDKWVDDPVERARLGLSAK